MIYRRKTTEKDERRNGKEVKEVKERREKQERTDEEMKETERVCWWTEMVNLSKRKDGKMCEKNRE